MGDEAENTQGASSGLRAWANTHPQDVTRARLKALTPALREGTVQHPFPRVAREDYLQMIKGAGIPKRVEHAPKVRVPLKDLVAIQGSVNMERTMQHAEDPALVKVGSRGSGHGMPVDMPIVVKKNGRLHLHDGHHRATAASLRGETSIRARLVDLDEEG